MYLTKPTGFIFQVIGLIIGIFGIIKLSGTPDNIVSGFLLTAIAIILIWRGGRRKERKEELKSRN
jgi:4-amino-4-deoxy-L-arabinose transferase-like glycosyltransferase